MKTNMTTTMKTKEIRNAIKIVYGMLWEVIALYEKTDCYNRLPKKTKGLEEAEESEETEELRAEDIWDFMGNQILEIRKAANVLLLGEEAVCTKLLRIVDETEYFVRQYERPGVVTRWKKINPKILFFDCAFELLKTCPKAYREISWGLSDLKLSCYPDKTLIEARNAYFSEIKEKQESGNFRYSTERVFQDELHRTLTDVFVNDFKEYL